MADFYFVYPPTGSGGGGGTVTANQGAPNTINNAWPVEITDHTNVVAVTAASTAAQATDPGAVVSLSPNSPLPAGTNILGSIKITDGSNTASVIGTALDVITGDTGTPGTITSTGTMLIGNSGYGSAVITVSGAWTGAIAVTATSDNSNFSTISVVTPSTGVLTNTIVANGVYLVSLAGISILKLQGATVTGTASITVRANQAEGVISLGSSLPAGANALGSVSVSNFPGTQTISGTVTANQGTSPWVENVSQFGGSNVVTGTGASGAGIPRITVANDSSLASVTTVSSVTTLGTITGAITLPTNAAQETGGHLASLDAKFNSLGQKTSANSAPVVLASDQSTVPFNQVGRTSVSIIRNDYSSVNVTTAAYVQLVASTSAAINRLDIFDSSGQTLVFAIGAAASEVNQFNIYPGGNGVIELFIPSGSRLSVKAVSATANSGELDINCFS